MLTKTKIVLAAALMLAAGSAARAGDQSDSEDLGGSPRQTWQDIEHSKLLVQQEAAGGSGAYASVPSRPARAHVKVQRHDD
jgi:hypothetical protein